MRAGSHGATVVAAVAALLAGCSKDDSSASGADTDSGPSTLPTTTVVDEPPATAVDDVQPIVSGLLGDYDHLLEEIVADPSLVEDGDGAVAQEFLELFEPGSDFADASLEAWAGWAEAGIWLERIDIRTPINATSIEGIVTPVSDDEVRFAKCTEQSYVRYDHGAEAQAVEGRVLAGEGTAVRVDGQWRLGVLTTPAGMQGCGTGR